MASLHRQAARIAFMLLLVQTLGGCGPSLAGLFGANLGTLNTTGKSLPDLAMSVALSQDCALVHLKYRKDYCRDLMAEALAEAMKPPKTCFRSLGQVQCYEGEYDPYGTRLDPVE